MRIHIFYTDTGHAWGGGNQFLKALKRELQKTDAYAEKPEDADAVLYNSYQELRALIQDFLLHPRRIRAYRLGPVFSLHRKGFQWKLVDQLVVLAASICADVVIFQSQWSLAQARRLGFWKQKNVFVIHNAVDSSVFYPATEQSQSDRIRLVYTSWSKNENKGFSYLRYLDEHLDFSRYQLTFIGNTPMQFTNIETLPPMPSSNLANTLRESDIFISPTKNDACSNAILEALACGLPVVALDSGGNGELVKDGGLLFRTEPELVEAIGRVSDSLESYRSKIIVQSIGSVSDQYRAAIHVSIRTS